MGFRVRFCNYPEEYPAVVRDICMMRSKGLLTLKTFYSMMRSYGIRRTRALIYQGCVERKEYTVYDEEGNEIPVDEIHDKLVAEEYRFVWMLKLSYLKKVHHEIMLEVTVEGTVQKHEMFPEPTEFEIQDTIATELEEKFATYLRDFWHILLRDLRRAGTLDDYESHIAEFEKVSEKYVDLEKGLEGKVTDVSIYIKRSEEADWKRNKTYSEDFYIYAETAVASVVDWILRTELEFLRREIESAVKETKEAIRELKKDTLRYRIDRAERVIDIKEVEKALDDALEKEQITYDEYKVLKEILVIRSVKVMSEIADKWCIRIGKVSTESELNSTMFRIMNTYTWKNELFEPYRDKVLECERRVRDKIIQKALEMKMISKEIAMKRVESHFRSRKEEIMKTTRSVRDLRDLIRRINRSSLPKEKKEELVKFVEENITSIQKEKCESAKKIIETETSIPKLRTLYYTIGSNRPDYEPCYEELRKAIRSKIRKRRTEIYKHKLEEMITEFKEANTIERVTMISSECSNIVNLPLDVQYKFFSSVIPDIRNTTELNVILNCLKNSPIYTEQKYSKMKTKIDALISKVREWITK